MTMQNWGAQSGDLNFSKLTKILPLGGDSHLLALADRIAKNLHVKSDEVAILVVSDRWRHLYFLVPQALRNVGHIPLSSTSALAARTVRESRPDIVNNFSTVRHASVFEGVKAESLTTSAIQKIISAPILAGGNVIWRDSNQP